MSQTTGIVSYFSVEQQAEIIRDKMSSSDKLTPEVINLIKELLSAIGEARTITYTSWGNRQLQMLSDYWSATLRMNTGELLFTEMKRFDYETYSEEREQLWRKEAEEVIRDACRTGWLEENATEALVYQAMKWWKPPVKPKEV